jgi:hypothetical protein
MSDFRLVFEVNLFRNLLTERCCCIHNTHHAKGLFKTFSIFLKKDYHSKTVSNLFHSLKNVKIAEKCENRSIFADFGRHDMWVLLKN